VSPEIATQREQAPPGRDLSAFRVRTFTPSDYVAVYEAQAGEAWGFTVADPLETGRAYEKCGPCFTGECEPTWLTCAPWNDAQRYILGCAGLSHMGHGVAEAWALLGPRLRVDRVARHWFKQQIRQRLPILMGEHGIRRLEANVGPRGLVFAWSLGFTTESEMPMWGPNGETFFKFVRFRPAKWDEVG
jgi:hypothetical protein